MPYSKLRNRYYKTLLDEPERFWVRVAQGDPDECWLWQGTISANGYGRAGKQKYAHRLAWQIANGPIPHGAWVLHHCDVPRCCNPDHLFLGDAKANAQDMAAKGRVRGGGPRHFDHDEACRLLAEGLSLREVGRRLGVSHSSIIKMLRRRGQ